MMKGYWIFFIVLVSSPVVGQFGFGFVTGLDSYQQQVRPESSDLQDSYRSVGSALLNPILGPKVWLGNRNFSLSLEAPINWGILAFDMDDFKGLGALSFPLGMKFNFGANSGFNDDQMMGFSFGGGLQYNRTELYGRTDEAPDIGFFKTYYGEAALGFGIGGADLQVYLRYGYGEEKAQSLNVGIVGSVNLKYFNAFKSKREDMRKRREQREGYSFNTEYFE